MSRLSSIRRLLSYLRFIPRLIRRVASWDGFWWVAGIAAVLVIGGLLSWHYWEELRGEQDSLSETVRNLGLVIGGAIAILLAVWRSTVSERQADTAQQGLLNERYQKGAEMLGSDVLSVRLGGIYALDRLASEHPNQYHILVMKLFCAFVRHPTQDKQYDLSPSSRQDVKDTMEMIRTRSEAGIRLERNRGFKLELNSADLRGMRLMDGDLSHAILTDSALNHAWLVDANLSGARLVDANLSGASLDGATLYGARLGGANLSNADLWSTNLSDAFLVQAPDDQRDETAWKDVKGLTQVNLDLACADPDGPPFLEGVVDAVSGKPLVWRGQPCHKNQELEG